MGLREIVICSEEGIIYGWQTLEAVPERFDEFRIRVQSWLDKNGYVLGEGSTVAGLKPCYVGEDFQRMEYNLIAPIVSGNGPYPLVDLISC